MLRYELQQTRVELLECLSDIENDLAIGVHGRVLRRYGRELSFPPSPVCCDHWSTVCNQGQNLSGQLCPAMLGSPG
jgi:hypothetical protein